MSKQEISIIPIAQVCNNRSEVTDDDWGEVISEIQLKDHISPDSLDGIESFSHLEILFFFDRTTEAIVWKSAHPRENVNWPKVGIFAQRKKDRPNHIGVTIVELIKREGNKLIVKGLDAIDKSPVIDIKPVMKEFLPKVPIQQPSWSSELMKGYW